jgi:hypothetical protein
MKLNLLSILEHENNIVGKLGDEDEIASMSMK